MSRVCWKAARVTDFPLRAACRLKSFHCFALLFFCFFVYFFPLPTVVEPALGQGLLDCLLVAGDVAAVVEVDVREVHEARERAEVA